VKRSNLIWLVGLRGFVIYFCSTELFCGSSFGIMFMREKLHGGWLWILNMAACGVGGFQMRFMGRMWWNYGRILGGVGGVF